MNSQEIEDRRIVLAGGNGFLGRLLRPFLEKHGYQVSILTRSTAKNASANDAFVHWDGRQLGDWINSIKGALAVINLVGRSVNCRYNRGNRQQIMASRIDSTRVLGEAISASDSPPAIWLNSSTATIYKHSFDQPMDEINGLIQATAEARDQFSVEVAKRWEQTFFESSTPDTRKIALRTGMVMAAEPGTVFDVLHRLVRFRLGGMMGNGKQFVSWIHGADFCSAIQFLIERDAIDGPINVTAPFPITNRELMSTFREKTGIRLGLPATRWMLELGAVFLRTETELILKSRKVVPKILLDQGFHFKYPKIDSALADLLQMTQAKTRLNDPQEVGSPHHA